MNRKGRARSSSLFLLELIIAILFFAIASAICVQIFVKSHLLSGDAKDLSHAVNVASSAAQTIDHAPSMEEITKDLESVFGDASHVYYDSNWSAATQETAVYRMAIVLEEADTMVNGTITVDKLGDDGHVTEIYVLDISHHLQGALAKGGAVDEE